MFIIANRHKEILALDGEFYPGESILLRGARIFTTEAEADEHRRTLHDYTRSVALEASL